MPSNLIEHEIDLSHFKPEGVAPPDNFDSSVKQSVLVETSSEMPVPKKMSAKTFALISVLAILVVIQTLIIYIGRAPEPSGVQINAQSAGANEPPKPSPSLAIPAGQTSKQRVTETSNPSPTNNEKTEPSPLPATSSKPSPTSPVKIISPDKVPSFR